MLGGHFRQAAHQQQRNNAADQIAQQYRRPRHLNGVGAAEKQPGADGAADRQHRHLPGGKMLVQPALAAGDMLKIIHLWHGWVPERS